MMPEQRRYLRVMRIKPYHFFLLLRTDPTDGQRFRMQEVVAVCKQCRCVSRRQHWLEKDSNCPVCGCADSVAIRSMQELKRTSPHHAVHSRRLAPGPALVLRLAAASILFASIMFLFIYPKTDPTGFYKTDDNRFYYLDHAGNRYTDGSYRIGNNAYNFKDGFVAGAYQLPVDDLVYLTDEKGRLTTGWHIMNEYYVHANEQGVVNERFLDVESGGFYDVEGLGNVYVTADGTAPSGWIFHQDGLYHLEKGIPAPLDGYAGKFDKSGRYVPGTEGFITIDGVSYFLHADGTTGRGLIAYGGYVYQLDMKGILILPTDQQSIAVTANTKATISPSGILMPETDVKLICDKGSVVLTAQTGLIRTGWFMYQRHVYCTDEQGYLLTNRENKSPKGRFDTEGRFVPDAAGPFIAGNLHCYLMADGALMTGFVQMENRLYLYDENGHLMPNAQHGSIGMTDKNGAFHPFMAGMYKLDGHYYCLDEQGGLLTGWQNCGKLYYFDPQTGRRATKGVLVNGMAYALTSSGAFEPGREGVYTLGGDAYYLADNGDILTGWHIADGKPAYFDIQTGKMDASFTQQFDPGWFDQGKERFYILSDGSAARGWQLIDQQTYYFSPISGAMQTGESTIDGTTYTFRADGKLSLKAPAVIIVDSAPLRIGKDGKPEGGLVYTDGHLFYYDPVTARLSKQLDSALPAYISTLGGYIIPDVPGLFTFENSTYYLEASGNVMTGWFMRDGQLYFADPATGLVPEDGRSKDWQGTFKAGCFTPENDGYFQTEGRSYYFVNGNIVHGWVTAEGSVQYIDPDTGLQLKNAVREIDGVSRRFDNSGRYCPTENAIIVPLTNGQKAIVLKDGKMPAQPGVVCIDKQLIAHGASGLIAANTSEAGLDSDKFSLSNGVVIPAAPGITEIHGEHYMLNSDGTCTFGVVLHDGYLYSFNSETASMNKSVLHFDENGIYRPLDAGLTYLGSNAYWVQDTTGRIATGLIQADDGIRYADENGCLRSGPVTLNGNIYFFDKSNEYLMAQLAFIHADDGRIYYAKEDGTLAIGWTTINDALHYFNGSGEMQYDTIVDSKYINIYGEVK